MPATLNMSDYLTVAENASYWFCIASIGERWVGLAAPKRSPAEAAFADEGLEVTPQLLMLLDISDGFELGVTDRRRAILLTGALAQDPENAYGGIDTWHVAPELRGHPDDFRCRHCDRVGCGGGDCQEQYQEDFPP